MANLPRGEGAAGGCPGVLLAKGGSALCRRLRGTTDAGAARGPRGSLVQALTRSLSSSSSSSADGSIHWQQPQKEAEAAPRPFYRPRAPSAEVELAAYVLLALLSKQPSPSPEELTAATGIVKWLSKQQNPMGGFSSTQVSPSGGRRGAGSAAFCGGRGGRGA